ncbi:beta-ketoacyl synthase chain length factor [Glaciimonas sp. CA11.2]|uniref:beta-ketoacyl synthase chain length factor n=2 Tax=Glaciimonas sp. CA11.2 TaxID=3048601 RepID=UPI002AB5613E|nr:beta-ketoacyl synthase chain length factor [Glaciimonas sp. CA11.2]MDY7547624.1 beta-ketoacyl synthase chain length factor [Glaciimonas sp. CA11.2]
MMKMSRDRAINGVQFSIAAHAAWAPGLETDAEWREWAQRCPLIQGDTEPPVLSMPAMLRRRAGSVGRMALEVAYLCLQGRSDVATVFCSRHGECARSVELLQDLVREVPLSPTSFSLSVHNATAGLLSIARHDQASHSALSAGNSGVEHAVIEACGLLADGAPEVLLVVYDGLLPDEFGEFKDCEDQPFAWAWLIQPTVQRGADTIFLTWESAASHSLSTHSGSNAENTDITKLVMAKVPQPAGLDILAFQLRQDHELIRLVDNRRWSWRYSVDQEQRRIAMVTSE